MISLAKAGDYSYLEIEKMTDKKNRKSDKKSLQGLASDLGISIVEDKKTYYDFCNMLTKKVDWVFHGTKKDFSKLEKLLNKKISKSLSDKFLLSYKIQNFERKIMKNEEV